MTAAPPSRLRGWTKHLVGATITLACLVVMARNIDFDDLVEAIGYFHWSYLLLGIASLAVGYALRILRWSMMLWAAGAQIGFRQCVAPFLGSIALNNVLPLRLGDIVRAFVFPISMGIPRTTATSSLVVERLIDLMTLLASLAIGLFAVRAVTVPQALRSSAVMLAIMGGIALAAAFLFSGMLARWLERLAAARARANSGAIDRLARGYSTVGMLFHGFEAMSRPRILALMLGLSMLIWTCESGLFYFALLGLGIEATPVMALLVMSVATLSTLAPSSPGYIGPFHLAAFTAISLMGGTSAQAGSYAVIVHFALWASTTLAGAIAIWSTPALFRAVHARPI